jgi:hypothetical protein
LKPDVNHEEKTVMKYFSIYVPDPKTNAGAPTGKRKEELDKFIGESLHSGQLVMGGGFLSIAQHGVVMRRTNGDIRIIDGPYAESKELLGGFAILEFASRDAAIDGARRFLQVVGDGECVTYQIMEGPHDGA